MQKKILKLTKQQTIKLFYVTKTYIYISILNK